MSETTTPTPEDWRDLGQRLLRAWDRSSQTPYQCGAFVARADVALLLAEAPTPEDGLRRVYEELRRQAEGGGG